jgi:hypothetical protein
VIHIIAIVTAKPGRRAETLEAVRDIAPLARAETGCIEYSPLVDLDSSAVKFGADSFVVVEKWKDEAASNGGAYGCLCRQDPRFDCEAQYLSAGLGTDGVNTFRAAARRSWNRLHRYHFVLKGFNIKV